MIKQALHFFNIALLLCLGTVSIYADGQTGRVSGYHQPDQSVPTRPEYRDILQISNELIERFPPDKYFILGLGRSPDPIITQLKIMNAQYASRIPLSSVKDFEDYRQLNLDLYSHGRGMFNRLLNRIFPDALVEGRTVIVLDYGWTGQSLEWGTYYLRRWARLTDRALNFKTLLLVEPYPGKTTRRINGRLTRILDAKDNPNLSVDFRIDLSRYPDFRSALNEAKY